MRTVAMPSWVKAAVDEWATAAQITIGFVWRSINKVGRVWGDGLTEKVIWQVLQQYARKAGLPPIAPDALRRTCAKLCRAAGGELEQTQLRLGHASVQATEGYLGVKQDLTTAPNDRIGLKLATED